MIGSEIFDPMRKKNFHCNVLRTKECSKKSTIFHILVLLQSRVVAQLLALVFRIVNSTVATRPKTFYDIINLGGLEGLNHAQGEGRRHCGKPLFYCYEITSKKKRNTPMIFFNSKFSILLNVRITLTKILNVRKWQLIYR